MKKLIICLLFFVMCSLNVFSQNNNITNIDYSDAFQTFATLVAVIPIVVEFAKKLLKITQSTQSWIVQLLSWLIGIGLTAFGWFFQLGYLNGLTWQWMLLYGFGASLAANGIADTNTIQWLFALIKKK